MRTPALAVACLIAASSAARASGLDDGVRLMSEKKYREAVLVLERESRRHPGAPEVLLNLGWAYWHVHRIDDARRVGGLLVKLDPDNRTFVIFLANTEIEKKDYAKAAALARRALNIAPGDRDALMVLSRAEFLEGRREEALRLLDRVIERFPDDAAASYRRAAFLAEMGRKKEALAIYDRLIASDPDNADYRRGRARALADLGRQDEATAEWKALSEGHPDAPSLMNLGWTYWKQKNYEAAWQIATMLMKLDPDNPTFLRFTANMEIERMEYPQALELARKAAARAPEDRDVQLTLAKALFRLQREREALAIMEKLIGQYPDNTAVQYRWAEFLGVMGQDEKALPYLDKLEKSDPANDAYRLTRASVLYDMGRYDDALAEWRALAARPEPHMGALRRLRDDAFNRRAWAEAVDWQKKIIAAGPVDPTAWERLARMYAYVKDYPNVLWAAEQAIAADPVPINPYYLKADALEQLERWPEAKAAYEEIVRRNPNSLRGYDGLSYVLEAQKDYRGALRAVKQIEDLTAPSVSSYVQIHKARLLADSGRFAWAHRLLKKAARRKSTVIPVLLYHGIGRDDRSDGVSQENLRAQLRMIKEKGYQTITVAELDEAFHGRRELPAKPIVLTFDDGRTDSFQNADPVLKELGFRATMFVHVSKLRKPHFHASPEDIARWQTTGRWDMQAHGSQAHDPMTLDAAGRQGHFLPNRMWLASAGRLETLDEYRARVESDYEKAKRGVEEIVPGHEVVAFAYPYGDYGQNDYTNTPESARINQSLVQKTFHLAFVQEQFGMNSLASSPTDLRRFEVPRDMTADQLATHLSVSDPGVQARMLDAQLWVRAEQVARAEQIYSQLEAEGVDPARVWADEGAAYARGGDLSYARSLFSKAEAMETDKEGPYGEMERRLSAQAEWAAKPAVSAEVQRFTDSDTNSISKLLGRAGVTAGPFRLEGWAGRGFYSDRRTPEAPQPQIREEEAGVEARGHLGRTFDVAGFYSRRAFERGMEWHTDVYSAAAGWQALPWLKLSARDGLSDVETAAAVRDKIRFHSDGGGIRLDPALNWTLTADYDQDHYSDTNLQKDIRAKIIRGFSERIELGAAYYHGDSRMRQPQYYTPRGLNQYTGIVAFKRRLGAPSQRTGLSPAELTLQYEGGYGFQPDGSRAVHSGRGELALRPFSRLTLTVGGEYSRSPTYLSRRAEGTLTVTF